MWIKKYISSLSRYNTDKWRIRAISKYFQVQRYLNLCFLLCLSLLRPLNLIRSEIVWQICHSLLLLTVPMGFIFFFLVPCPFPISLWSEEKYRSHDMKIDSLQWNLCLRKVCLQWAPQAAVHVCRGLTLAKKMMKSPIPPLFQEIPQYLLCLQLGSVQLWLLPTLTCTWGAGFVTPVSSRVGLTELKWMCVTAAKWNLLSWQGHSLWRAAGF